MTAPATGLLFGGRRVLVPGVTVRNYLDDPALRLGAQDRRARRTRWIRSIYIHTAWGVPPILAPGAGPPDAERRMVRNWRADDRCAGAHGCIAADGEIGVYADLLTETTYHAEAANEVSVGFELEQTRAGVVYEATYVAAVELVWALCAELGIQAQCHAPYRGYLHRLFSGGEDAVGVFGHRDQTYRKGPGDPGDEFFERFRASGAEAFDFGRGDDVRAWRDRQAGLNGRRDRRLNLSVDGVPGPATVAALLAAGRPHGLWAQRKATS